MTTFWTQFWTGDRGQDLIEYTLMLAFVALASAALFSTAGRSVNIVWPGANSPLSAASVS